MGIWKVPSVKFEPDITLVQWSVFEVPAKNKRYFVGYSVWGREGRVSSAIIDFDHEARVGKTASGRTYELHGHSGASMDAMYVWSAVCIGSGYKKDDYINVSSEYCGN